jgi:hypothetical protein
MQIHSKYLKYILAVMKVLSASRRLLKMPILSRCICSNAQRLIQSNPQLTPLASCIHTNTSSKCMQYARVQNQASYRPFSLRCASSSSPSDAAASGDSSFSKYVTNYLKQLLNLSYYLLFSLISLKIPLYLSL